MATQCRNAKINRNKRMKLYANMILVLLVLIGGVLGFFLAKLTTPPQETITVTKTVEAPAYKPNVAVSFRFFVCLYINHKTVSIHIAAQPWAVGLYINICKI